MVTERGSLNIRQTLVIHAEEIIQRGGSLGAAVLHF